MFSDNRARALRFTLAIVFAILLHSALLLSHRPAPIARAANEPDPDVIWSIGKTDNSNDEFAAGGARTLVYEVGRSSPARDWRERQDETAIYTIRFPLDQPPPSAVLVLEHHAGPVRGRRLPVPQGTPPDARRQTDPERPVGVAEYVHRRGIEGDPPGLLGDQDRIVVTEVGAERASTRAWTKIGDL